MGSRGPLPLDEAVLKMRGAARRKKAATLADGITITKPARPHWLSESASELWSEHVKLLAEARIPTVKADGTALALLVEALTRYIALRDFVDENGQTIVGKRGVERPRPEAKAMLVWLDAAVRLMSEFGMTPKSRARLPLTEPKRLEHSSKAWEYFPAG